MQEPDSNDREPIDPKDAETAALRAELVRLKTKRAETKDRDIIAVLEMRINQIELTLPPLAEGEVPVTEAPADKAEEDAANLASLPPPSPVELEQAEKLIRQSRLEKQRGNLKAATEALKKAVAVAPGSAVVMEAMADDLLEHKQIKQARAMLKQAHLLDPKNVGLERKYAEAVLKGSANMSVEDQLRYGGGDSMFLTGNDNVAGIVAARFLSALIPGVGQMVIGRTTKGIILFACNALCYGLIILWQKDVKALLLMFSKAQTGAIHPIVFVPIAGIVIIWAIAMSDLSGGNKDRGARNIKVDRPKPPVDLPFE